MVIQKYSCQVPLDIPIFLNTCKDFAKKKNSKTFFSLFQSGSGCSGSMLKYHLTRVFIAYRFNEIQE